MRRYYLRLSNINIAINIEEKYRDYFSKLFSDFWCMDYSGPSDVVINYKYVEKNIIMNIVDSIQWHRAGIAEMYGQKDGNKYFYMKLLQNGEVDGEKIIICSKDMCYFEVLFDCQTAHCGRCKPHNDFGELTSPIVPYRNLPQTPDGMTADWRSIV